MLYVPLSPTFPWWLNRVIRDFAPDLLHLHLPNTSAFAALLLPRARRIPWLVHWHADVVASVIDRRLALAYGLYRPLEQRLLRRSRSVIVTSPPYLEASQALTHWHERCTVIPLGLDSARLPEPDAASLKEADQLWGPTGLRVLTIGRLTYYKGHEVLISAAASLPGVRVLILGQGEHRQRLRDLITSLGLTDRVTLTGFMSEVAVAALLASCDLFCLPSLERTEAFGLVLLEAMRYGKALIVSDIPGSGAPWVVQQAGNGRLFPPANAQVLAQTIAALRDDTRERQRLGQAGIHALQRQFGIEAVARNTLDLYDRVTGKPTTDE
jgi:rhamnosyl/mannosyltransferase